MFFRNLAIVILSTLLVYYVLILLQTMLLLEFAFQGINAYITFVALIFLNICVLKILPEETAKNLVDK